MLNKNTYKTKEESRLAVALAQYALESDFKTEKAKEKERQPGK